MPSVSAASAAKGVPSAAWARASRNSVLRPPRPGARRRVTVVSPPDSSTTGRGKGRSRSAISRAIAAWTRPTSRASPSMASERITAGTPSAAAHAAAASSESRAEAMTRTSFPAKTGSAGSGAAPASPSSQAATGGGRSIRQSRASRRASARLVRSGTVGPEATCAGSSPGTSETMSETTRAGCASAARRPPLIPETCLRIAFMTEIGAPLASSARFNAASSSSVSAPGGIGNSADPPPLISATTRSSAVRLSTASKSAAEAACPAASGTGWAASSTRIARVGAP